MSSAKKVQSTYEVHTFAKSVPRYGKWIELVLHLKRSVSPWAMVRALHTDWVRVKPVDMFLELWNAPLLLQSLDR